MKQLSLFDEEVYVEIPVDQNKYQSKVQEMFNRLLDISKEKGNPYYLSLNEIPAEIQAYLLDFKKQKFIEMNDISIHIQGEYLKFHTVEELVQEYQQKIEEILSKPNFCWYKNILSISNFFGPYQYRNEQDRQLFYQRKQEIDKEVACRLGLKHFLEVPSSRGEKMKILSSKWARKYVIPIIVERVLAMDDYDEVQEFFKNAVFFCGRRDWDWEDDVAPYPEFKKLQFSKLEIASLAQAKDEETIKLVLDYAGCVFLSSNYNQHLKENEFIIYPEGWSFEKYEESLTDEDKEKIRLDQERLKRLHNEIRK